ncbi:MAG: TldD/PmbA family protein [Clostridia bacterium]|nr:TldD/PmbA family protein [Clostridia bacterium]MBR5044522.1 TldD/PmbA family protein [Clostridia bacterium]
MLQEFVSTGRDLFALEADAEVRRQRNTTRSIALVQGDLLSNDRSETAGVSARVIRGGVAGFASIADVSEESVRRVLDEAKKNAVFLDGQVALGKPNLPAAPRGSFRMTREPGDPEQKAYVEFARAVDEYVVKNCPKLVSRQLVFRVDSMEKVLTVSGGTDAHTFLPRCYLYLFFTANTPDGTPVDLFTALGGYGSFDKLFRDPKDVFPEVDLLYGKLLAKTEGVRPEAGLKTCILGGELTGMLAHEAVGHTVEADLVLGGSVAGPMLGKTVASPLVSLVDFAHSAFGKSAPLPVYVDDEGTPAVDAEIIRDGILVGYMNNRDTAVRFGMKPQGNARAYAFSDEPLIRMRNTAILPGKSRLSDMIASVEDGYYLTDTNNGQADTTGEFMFGISMGYEIKNGKLGRALLDTTISGVAFEMLKTVDMVSDTVTWSSSGFCGKKQPMPVGLGGPELRCQLLMGGR